MPVINDYQDGTYIQHDLPVRQRLRDEDVKRFIDDWLCGKSAQWIARQYRSPDYLARPGAIRGPLTRQPGKALSYQMVFQHVRRLVYQGHIDPQYARQPAWSAQGNDPLEVPADPYVRNVPRGAGGYKALPPGLRRRRGRPPKYGKPRAAPPDPMTQMRGAAAAHSDPANAPLVITIYDPDAKPPEIEREQRQGEAFTQAAQAIDKAEAAARHQLEQELEAARARADAEMQALMRTPTDQSTTGDHQERIRPHGADRSDDQRATMLQNQGKEGTDDDTTQGRHESPASGGTPQARAHQAGRHRDQGTDPGPGAAHQDQPAGSTDHPRGTRRRARGAAPQEHGQPQGKRRTRRNAGKETQGNAATPGPADRGDDDTQG